jgi:hypothetical protein
MIKFNKYNVTDTETKNKERVFYALDNRTDKRPCVTLYSKDYGYGLYRLFGDLAVNNTDTMTDYFEKSRVVLFEDHPLYPAARARAIANKK